MAAMAKKGKGRSRSQANRQRGAPGVAAGTAKSGAVSGTPKSGAGSGTAKPGAGSGTARTGPGATRSRPARGAPNRARRVAPPPARGGSVGQGVRRGLGRPLTIGIVALVLFGGYYGYLWLQSRKPPGPLEFASPASSLAPRNDLPGLQVDPPPWDAALGSLRSRLDELGLPALPAEVTDVHFHLHLDVLVDGKAVGIPDDIGRNAGAGYLTVIHTHDDSGVIHIESPPGHEYTLGQLFDVWGVRFTGTCLGGLCNDGDRQVRVYADGSLLHRDPRLLILGRHQEIVVTYGTASQVPDPVPSRYGFPLGA
jgi:hypothetical protein